MTHEQWRCETEVGCVCACVYVCVYVCVRGV